MEIEEDIVENRLLYVSCAPTQRTAVTYFQKVCSKESGKITW